MNSRAAGSDYERKAAGYLRAQGMQIICMNYHWKHGEIDIIAKDKSYLVFIEVKYRKHSSYGYPYEAVDYYKQQRIRSGATVYMLERQISFQTPCRFDVISISGDEITHYKNAF